MGIEIHKPFSQPICLVPDTRIAGTTHVDDIDELAPRLSVGERLALVREKDNRTSGALGLTRRPADAWAFPAVINEIPARLMDGRKALYAEVNKVEKIGGWWKIGMGV